MAFYSDFEYHIINARINSGDDVAILSKYLVNFGLFVYFCICTGRKSAYSSSFVALEFKNAFDNLNADDPATAHINLVAFRACSNSGVSAAQLCTAGVDKHSGLFISVRSGAAL